MGRLAWVLGGLSPEQHTVQRSLHQELARAGWVAQTQLDGADAILVWCEAHLEVAEAFLTDSRATRRPLFLLGSSLTSDLPRLAEASGVVAHAWSPAHPARVRPDGELPWIEALTPLSDHLEMTTSVLSVDKVRDSVETWVSAPSGLSTSPVVTWNGDTGVGLFTALPLPDAPSSQVAGAARLLHLTLLRALGDPRLGSPRPIRVGLLGFGAIGAEHARAAQAHPALQLSMVCDRSPQRLAAVADLGLRPQTTEDAETLLAADLELVVVSTPPDTHADWAVRALDSGKHVVLEKPMALTAEAADRVLDSAAASGRRVVTFQNRRFDSDFRTVREEIESGHLGEVFHLETFVGGYQHPCNYWHSDSEISGGSIYDWGAHVIDQILLLHPEAISHISCIEHKRRWFDVTNADHTSLIIRFRDGAEASFVHSDLAAALKPRWYVLGTTGALVSRWRSLSVIGRTEIGTLSEDRLAPADAPPEIRRIDQHGAATTLVPPAMVPYGFHRELVDDLRFGWPMSVNAQQSRRVVAVMEAARASAAAQGQLMPVAGEPHR